MEEKEKQDRDLEPRLTIRYAASLLGVSQSTIRRLEKSGKLLPKLHTPGGHRRYCLKDVMDLMEILSKKGA